MSRGDGDIRSAHSAHLVSGRRLAAQAERLCRALAPDVACGPFYVVLRPDLPVEYQGGDGGALALTSRHLDLLLQPTLERQRRWRGRGPAILLDPAEIAAGAARRPRPTRVRIFPPVAMGVVLHEPREVDPLEVVLRLPRAERSSIADLSEIYIFGQRGERVQLRSIGEFRRKREDQTIYHKDLRRVAYVYAEVAGRPPGDAIVDIQADRRTNVAERQGARQPTPRPLAKRSWLSPGGDDPWHVAAGFDVAWASEGEWEITLRVFRDLGIAYAAALVLIFIILMFQTGSRVMPLIIMLAIPLTLIGIMPGFWLLNMITANPVGGYANPVFFTATAMIGMIVLAGIVIRNSVLLIEFIKDALGREVAFREAILQSVAVRTRPILLTAATTLVGNIVITLDPVFSGLAWAIIFGIITSNLFTLVVIPIVYGLVFGQTRTGDLDRRDA